MTDIFSTKGVVDSFIEQRGFIPIVFLHRIDAENEWNMYDREVFFLQHKRGLFESFVAENQQAA